MNKRVNIFLLSYYNPVVLDNVVRQIRKVTKYDNYRIIVGENRSENSIVMRKKLEAHLKEGLVDKAYLFDGNFMANTMRYIVKDNMDFDYCTIGDYDAYIMDPNDNSCWVNDFTEKMESDPKTVLLQFSASNNPLYRSNSRPEIIKNNEVKWTVDGVSNGHYMMMRKDFVTRYMDSVKTPVFVDGDIMSFVKRISAIDGIAYKRLRYDWNSVINLSSEMCGISDSFDDVLFDQSYLEKRKRTLHGGINEEGIGFLTYRDISPDEVEVLSR